MAYDEYLADRLRRTFSEKNVHFETKKMIGGLCFLVDDKMCCGIHFDKKKNTDLLMARIGEAAATEALLRPGCHPMDFTGRPMKNFVFITPDGFDSEDDLSYWIDKALEFNPLAVASKKKNK